MNVRGALIEFLIKYFDVTDETQINEELAQMDSLDQADLGYRIENLFNCVLSQDAKLNSLDELVLCITETSKTKDAIANLN
jgi:acyl carrier protein